MEDHNSLEELFELADKLSEGQLELTDQEIDEELRRQRGGDRGICAECGFGHEGVGQSGEHPLLGELPH